MFFYSNATTTSRFTSNAHKLQLAHFCRSPVDWSGAQEASLQTSRENARENFSLLFFFVVAWLKCNRLGLYCLHFLRLFPGRGIFSHARHTARLDRHVHERESHQRLCVGLVIARNLKPTFLSSFIYFFFFFVVIANWIFLSSTAHDGWCYAGSSRASVYWGNNIQYIFCFSSVFAR